MAKTKKGSPVEYDPASLAQDLLDQLCTVKPGLTVGIEYDKALAIDAFNRWGEKYGIKYADRKTS